MKTLCEIYDTIFQRCENEKVSLADQFNLLHHAAEEYIEYILQNHELYKENIIKKDLEELMVSSRMMKNNLNNADGTDKKTVAYYTRYIDGIDNFQFCIYNEIKRYGYFVNDNRQIVHNQSKDVINPETGDNGCLNTGDKKLIGEAKPLNKAQVEMNVRNEPFEPKKDGSPIPYKKCYERLTEGKIRRPTGEVKTIEIIDKQCDYDLFKYCVDRADISKIFKSRRKSYARLFMNDIAEYFENPSSYRKAAAIAFHVTKLNVGTNGEGIRADYRKLMKGLFPDHANYQKKMPNKSK